MGVLDNLGETRAPTTFNQQPKNTNVADDPQAKVESEASTKENKTMRFNKVNRFVAAALLAALVLTTGPAFAAAAPAGKVNLNTATVSQLVDLPGIGPALAARIVEHRQKNGAFKTVEDVMAVRGIGEKNFAKIQSLLSVGASTAPKETPKQ